MPRATPHELAICFPFLTTSLRSSAFLAAAPAIFQHASTLPVADLTSSRLSELRRSDLNSIFPLGLSFRPLHAKVSEERRPNAFDPPDLHLKSASRGAAGHVVWDPQSWKRNDQMTATGIRAQLRWGRKARRVVWNQERFAAV